MAKQSQVKSRRKLMNPVFHLQTKQEEDKQLTEGLIKVVRKTGQLNLSGRNLSHVPPRMFTMYESTGDDTVNLDFNKPSDDDESWWNFKPLNYLDLSSNVIEELPDRISMFEDLAVLNEIPIEFCENMSHLKILDLRDNKIETVPEQIAMLQHVIRLDLTNNELTLLPNSLGLLPHLQNLQIEGNKLKQIRTDIVKGGTHRILRHLREKMDEAELENVAKTPCHLPVERKLFPDKYVMRNSRALNVNMKELTNIPDEVFKDAKFAEVTIIDLCKNKLQQVPFGMKIIADDISELNLSMNQLQEIPEFFSECQRLKYLDLGNNLLTDLPDCLSSLIYLRELVISNNKFTKIPGCVYEMVGLEILLAGDNKIIDIDIDGLKKLKRIATLDLSNNNIGHVPPELGNITQLRNLELKGNCFRQPRYAILEQGTESILSYLRDRIPR